MMAELGKPFLLTVLLSKISLILFVKRQGFEETGARIEACCAAAVVCPRSCRLVA